MDSKNTENHIKSTKSNNHSIKSKEKCYYCNKKLKMIHFTCRCNHKFYGHLRLWVWFWVPRDNHYKKHQMFVLPR